MSADLLDLQAPFRAKVVTALGALQQQGLTFRPYFTQRDPIAQAKLWRQSRSGAAIAEQIARLRVQQCRFIADCLDRAGPCNGPPVTNAIPGLSWHQYGLAVDCVLLDGDKDVWNSPAYATYDSMAAAHGMTSGRGWGDIDHWQDVQDASPLGAYGTLQAINDKLALAWPNLL